LCYEGRIDRGEGKILRKNLKKFDKLRSPIEKSVIQKNNKGCFLLGIREKLNFFQNNKQSKNSQSNPFTEVHNPYCKNIKQVYSLNWIRCAATHC